MAARKADIHLIVGLGNPGADYQSTRHNAGFWLLDEIASKFSAVFRTEKKFFGETARLSVGDRDVHLLKPQTFMNKSGQGVAALANYFKIQPQQILVAHDELDLSPGDNRLKVGGGHGGHNGLRDIISHLADREFFRLRIGIGHPGDRNQVVNYVLHQASKLDLELIQQANQKTLDVLPTLLQGEFEKAMQTLHSK